MLSKRTNCCTDTEGTGVIEIKGGLDPAGAIQRCSAALEPEKISSEGTARHGMGAIGTTTLLRTDLKHQRDAPSTCGFADR